MVAAPGRLMVAVSEAVSDSDPEDGPPEEWPESVRDFLEVNLARAGVPLGGDDDDDHDDDGYIL